MLSEVIAFALIMSASEFVLISMITPRTRLRMLGSDSWKMTFHVGMFVANLTVHWGTVVGTMSATLSFITSILVINVAIKTFGCIKSDRFYTVGLVKYSVEELR